MFPQTMVDPKVSPAAADDLLAIVEINEEIKGVVAVAFRFNIMALNAIFLAKRAGQSALGFGVLSNELRSFSLELRGSMDKLGELIHGAVGEVSLLLRAARHDALLAKAIAVFGEDATQQFSQGEDDEVARGRLDDRRRQLRFALEDCARLVELGGVLVKSAKIEAAYGQGFAPALAQVSGEFDGIVDEIRQALGRLQHSPFLRQRRP